MKQSVRRWRDLTAEARVTASSEDVKFPIGLAVASPPAGEWRAAAAGEQSILVAFTEPSPVNRVRVVIRDGEHARTQELTVGWCAPGDDDFVIAVRQQFNFDPRGANVEVEEYALNLTHVSALEVRIVPDISGGLSVARLSELRIA